MAYVVMCTYSGSSPRSGEELATLAKDELAPTFSANPGVIRFATLLLTDGKIGSFLRCEDREAAENAKAVVADLVESHPDTQGLKLDEVYEGDVFFSTEGPVPLGDGIYGIGRIYMSDASIAALAGAFEQEARDVIEALPGLVIYNAIKAADGRICSFSSFDNARNARASSDAAESLRGRVGSRIGRLLQSPPRVIEATLMGIFAG